MEHLTRAMLHEHTRESNPQERIEHAIREILLAVGEDADREGLQDTPRRVREYYENFTAGYAMTLQDVVHGALEPAKTDGMIIIKKIDFASLCEHHLLPFSGTMHVGYLPDKHQIGFSKIARIIEMYAHRFQMQERLGEEICDALCEVLQPKGVGILIEAQHFCMTIRGVKKQGATAITSHTRGLFKTDPKTQMEFLKLSS